MSEVAIQTVETVSTSKATTRLEKILDSTYVKTELEQVAGNATHLNTGEITKLLKLL